MSVFILSHKKVIDPTTRTCYIVVVELITKQGGFTMERIQFYPNEHLLKSLNEDAKKHNVAISTLVTDMLNRYYGLVPNASLSESDLTTKVFDEVKAYILNLQSGDEFDLISASTTFANINMVYAGKPSTIRAKIGKNFAKKIGKIGIFHNVSVKLKSDGNIKRNQNNAAIYVIPMTN